jgi:hypothetical protein
MAKAKTSTEKDPNNLPSKTSAIHEKLAPSWKYTQDLWGSSLDIRNRGVEYLPAFNQEPDKKYNARKNNSVFENEFRLTIETFAGMVFRSDPKPDDVVPEIEDMFTDIDLCGNSLWSWSIDNFEMFLRDGNGYIYVDAPPLKPEVQEKVEAGQKPTLRDRAGDRPFWVFYKASQLVNFRYQKQGSRDILVQATFKEVTFEADGEYGEKEVTRYRVLRPGSWELFEENPSTKEFDLLKDSGKTGLKDLNLIPIKRPDASPPLLTLALLNVLHYNQTSDYDSICHLVCTPIRVQKYDQKQDAVEAAALQVASPGVGLKIWGDKANVFYVEIEGKGLDKARQRYQDISQRMARIGSGMLMPDEMATVRTATEVIDAAGQRQSKLSRLARDWENAVEKALYLTAQYFNAIQGRKTIDLDDAEQRTKLKLKMEYDRLTFTMEQVKFFSDLVDSNKLSLFTFLQWLPQVVDMPPGFDPAEEMKRIAAVNTIVTDGETDPGPESGPDSDPDSDNDPGK